MIPFLLVSWGVVIWASYKLSVYALDKSNNL